MGTKRVEGKVKKKSIKAKITSKTSSKRKLSRNGKKIKKGMMGPSTDFMTRSAVIKKLQITLKDFRRLCILKGIYPRVPSKAPAKGADKIYYDIKDISYLAHEPLLHKFREFKSFMKKIRKASGRKQFDEARRKDRIKPVMNLDHLVRERYPRFIDALRDMDDALCMIHLFAAMPSIGRITSEKTLRCKELVQQWQYICIKSKSLRKVFISVKGIYFQVELMGESITWIAPHPFTQSVPQEVDVRVMMTFLEFYEVFLKFVMYKLYHMEGLNYPPVIDKNLADSGCLLLSIKTTPLEANTTAALPSSTVSTTAVSTVASETKNQQSAQKLKKKVKDVISAELISSLNHKINELTSGKGTSSSTADATGDGAEEEEEEDLSVGHLEGPLSEVFATLHGSGSGGDDLVGDEERRAFQLTSEELEKQYRTDLFSKYKFYVNREVPLDWMQFCILAFGGHIGWESPLSPYGAGDACVTHHVIDRPLDADKALQTREYIQPQWIFDSINMNLALPTQHYRPGSKLPPHLSPFVDDDKEGYVPRFKEELERLRRGEQAPATTTATTAITNSTDDDEAVDEEEEGSDDEEEEEEKVPAYTEVRSGKSGMVKGPKAVVFPTKSAGKTEVSYGLRLESYYVYVHIRCICRRCVHMVCIVFVYTWH